jgi:hypothetical protein
LKCFKKFFKGWGSNIYGHAKKRKLELKEELATLEALEENSELPPTLSIRKTIIFVELMELYANEELLWYQKSHGKWLLEGIRIQATFIVWLMVANGKIPCTP